MNLNSINSSTIQNRTECTLIHQVIRDVTHYLSNEQQLVLINEIKEFIKSENLVINTSSILKAMASYATSYFHYGPLISEWAESLLETAVLSKRKLIFLARDGIPVFEAVKKLKALNPEKYQQAELSLIYISRTLAYSSTNREDKISSSDESVREYVNSLQEKDNKILQKYIVQEAKLVKGDRCIFVDIGFSGNIIPPIIEQLNELDIDVKFSFLISHTTKEKIENRRHRAKGFLAHREKRPLEVVDKAGGNPAIHWLEDTHQSTLHSAKLLIKKPNGKIVPAILKKEAEKLVTQELLSPPQTCKDEPEKYLIKTFGLKGVLDFVKPSYSPLTTAWRLATDERRVAISDFLTQFKEGKRELLIKH